MVPGVKLVGVIAAIAGGLSSVAHAELNLTPLPSVREFEGCKFPQVEFQDEPRKVTYEPPQGWSAVARDRHNVTLVPAGKDMVSVKINFIPTAGRLTLDEAQLAYFRNSAHQLLPPNGKLAGEPSVVPNPLLLGGHPTCELQIEFVLHAERMRMGVLLVDLGETQLRFSLIARQAEFEELQNAFRSSWYSWQWHGAAPDLVASAAR